MGACMRAYIHPMFVLDMLILVTVCRGGMGITSTWACGALYRCRWGVGGCWWWCDSVVAATGGGLGYFNSVVFVTLGGGLLLVDVWGSSES